MTEEIKTTPAETIAIAADEAAKVVSVAADEAKKVVEQASNTAFNVIDREYNQEQKISRMLVQALTEVFGDNEEAQRFVDVKKIPLICKSIIDIHGNIEKINEKLDNKFVTKDQFSPIRLIVYGAVTMILTGVFGAMLSLVILNYKH